MAKQRSGNANIHLMRWFHLVFVRVVVEVTRLLLALTVHLRPEAAQDPQLAVEEHPQLAVEEHPQLAVAEHPQLVVVAVVVDSARWPVQR